MYTGLHVKYPLFLSDFKETYMFSEDARKILNYQISRNSSNGSRVVPCGRTDRHDEANSRSSEFYNAPKNPCSVPKEDPSQ